MGNASCFSEVSHDDLERPGVDRTVDGPLVTAPAVGSSYKCAATAPSATANADHNKDVLISAKDMKQEFCETCALPAAACNTSAVCQVDPEVSVVASAPAPAVPAQHSPPVSLDKPPVYESPSKLSKVKKKQPTAGTKYKGKTEPSGAELGDALAKVSKGVGDKADHDKALEDLKDHREKTRKINERMEKVMADAKTNGDPLMASLKEQLLFGFGSLQVGGNEGRPDPVTVAKYHYILEVPMEAPWPDDFKVVVFANGCFWGSEKGAWRLPGVYSTAVGYAAGKTMNPQYNEVCAGRTGATEAVQVVYDPAKISLVDILRWFWESHDPTQGNGQGGDKGTQYRSGLYYFDKEQRQLMERSKDAYGQALRRAGKGEGPRITTEIKSAEGFGSDPGKMFYYAEDEHQQYLAKPDARQYCGAEPQGVSLPPFSSWATPELQAHKPKLPQSFWQAHAPRPGGCITRSPQSQIVWPPPAE